MISHVPSCKALCKPAGSPEEGLFGRRSYPQLDALFSTTVDLHLIAEQREGLVRVAASLKNRIVSANVIARRLASSASSNRLAKALLHLGQLVRTVYLLRYLNDPVIRQQVRTQLNRGEARQDLAQWLFFADQGMFRSGDYYQMMNRASCLSLPSIHESILKTAMLMSYARRPPEEICCDAFAAECLLPYDFFKKAVDQYPLGFGSIGQLAADYEASLVCTGSRFAVVNEAPCALILAESGVVRYVSYSKPMRELKCWIKTGIPLPVGSAAHKIRSGQILDGPIEVDAELWIDDPRCADMSLLE